MMQNSSINILNKSYIKQILPTWMSQRKFLDNSPILLLKQSETLL